MSPYPSTPTRHLPRTLTVAIAAALAGTAFAWGTQSGAASPTEPVWASAEATRQHRVVTSPDAPAAIGPYSQAIAAGNQLYLSGQLPIDPQTGQIPAGSRIDEQTRQVLKNLSAVLEANEMTLADVVSTTVYLSDLDDFAAFNAAYAEFFPQAPPARATIEVARVPRDAKVEIAAIAIR